MQELLLLLWIHTTPTAITQQREECSVVLSCTQAPHQLTTKNKWSPVQASHGRAHILEYLINISSETQCFADTSLVQLQVRNCWEIWLLLVDGSKWKLLPMPFVFLGYKHRWSCRIYDWTSSINLQMCQDLLHSLSSFYFLSPEGRTAS